MTALPAMTLASLVFDTHHKDLAAAIEKRIGGDPYVVIDQTLPVRGDLLVCNITTNGGHPYYRIRPAEGGVVSQGRAVAFCGYRRQGKIVLSRPVLITPGPQQPHEVRVRAAVVVDDDFSFIDREDFARLNEALPMRRLTLTGRLAEERAYLEWREQLAQLDREAWLILGRAWDPKGLRLALTVQGTQRALEKVQDDELHYLPLSASKDPGRFVPVDNVPRSRVVGEPVGVELDRADQQAVVVFQFKDQAAFDEAQGALPSGPGWLTTSIIGELAQIRMQSSGLDRLINDNTCMPALPGLLFEASHPIQPADPAAVAAAAARPEFAHLTDDQKQAAALCEVGPALVCVQGPPGTGKTTVCAAAVLAAVNDGKTVCVASQSNLAVDNLLGRLPNDPRVRPVRAGKEDRVEAEARRFLPKNVVRDYWLPCVVAAAEARARDGQALAERAKTRQQARDTLRRLANAAQIHGKDRDAARTALGKLHAQQGDAQAKLAQARDTLAREQAEADAWAALAAGELSAAGLPDGDPVWPELAAALGLPYATPEQVLAALGEPLDSAAVDRALAACQGQAVDSPEVRALEAEKRRLIDSDDEADLPRLIEVNRALKARRGEAGGWPAVTRSLAALVAPGLPDLAPVVDALTPDEALCPTLQAFRDALHARAAARPAALARLQEVAAKRQASAKTQVRKAKKAKARAQDKLDTLATREQAAAEKQTAAEARLAELRQGWDAAFAAVQDGPAPAPSADAAAQAAEPDAWDLEHTPALERHQKWEAVRQGFLQRARDAKGLAALTERYLRRVNVVGVTCHEAGKLDRDNHPLHHTLPFDRVIIDEVSKATGPELVLPALLAKERVILIGDPNQLPPTFRHRAESFAEAIEEGLLDPEDFERFKRLVTSMLFEELYARAPDGARAMLTTQFRAHPDIGQVTNVFYGGALRDGPGTDRRQHGLHVADARGGVLIAPDDHAVWIDSGRDADGERVLEAQEGSSKANPHEAALAVDGLHRIGAALAGRGLGGEPVEVQVSAGPACDGLVALGRWAADDVARLFADGRVTLDGRPIKGDQVMRGSDTLTVDPRVGVGLITLYGAQRRRLRRLLDQAAKAHPKAFGALDVRLSTVDRFQGMEAPIVLVSLVRATDGGMGNFAKDFRRINVALSRAQALLVVLGDREGLGKVKVDLPKPGHPGQVQPAQAYGRIQRLIDHAGGRRHAGQLTA